jgi:5-methylcytosine-specific restriction endonuclease McrA
MPAHDYRYQTRAWRAVRALVLERDRHTCAVQREGCTTVATTVDHIVSVSEGGDFYDPTNLRAACPHCNSSRGWRERKERNQFTYRVGVARYKTRF